jgi:transposase
MFHFYGVIHTERQINKVNQEVHTMRDNIIAGIDLAKNIMHFVITDQTGNVVNKFKTNREEFLIKASKLSADTLFAMEACGGSNYWAQEIKKLGYEVKLLKTKDVKIYASSKQKNDYNDALAITKAARDPELKEVRTKTKEQQGISLLHKTRQNTIRDRVQKTNSLMSTLMEFGYVTLLSKSKFCKMASEEINAAYDAQFINKKVLDLLKIDCEEIVKLCLKEKTIDKLIVESNKESEDATRLQGIKGIGPINASCLNNSSMESCRDGRDFAASLGLVPKQFTSGDSIKLGSITKQGDRYTRTMLIQAGRSIVIRAKTGEATEDKVIRWTQKKILEGKPFNLLCVAVANKLARIAYKVKMDKVDYIAA